MQIVTEGKHRKFKNDLQQLTYSGKLASSEQRKALFVTERAVFAIQNARLRLQKIAPGIDLTRDSLAHMDFMREVPDTPLSWTRGSSDARKWA
ncbi:hypothetical protein D4A92_23195 (plasmid) [Rhizobium rosettiformans]|uniref:Uncharacterized protein n=1 Tax=Rhizobium rosettiformans TaxID=1368430 RepID=A0ABX7F1S8_9HYPH|nr:hypothetical protein [Rhizobium rosettiformans]QRF54418.1 hypothetical protein D4A92_23195 [Rhizobium rosettiformans]